MNKKAMVFMIGLFSPVLAFGEGSISTAPTQEIAVEEEILLFEEDSDYDESEDEDDFDVS